VSHRRRGFANPEEALHGGEETDDQAGAGDRRAESIEGRIVAHREFRLAGLTAEILDLLMFSVGAIADQGLEAEIGDALIRTVEIWTGATLGHDGFWAATRAFDLAPEGRQWPSRNGLG